jgi:hypothetical protein
VATSATLLAVKKTLLAVLLLLAASPAAAAPAPAARRTSAARPIGTQSLSVWAVLDPGPIDGVGFGGRLMLPIAPGVLHHPRVRDEFTLELGGDFVHYEDRIGVTPFSVDYAWNGFLLVGGATWNFWFTPQLALYPKLDVGYFFGWYSARDYGPYARADFDGLFLQGAAGLIYKLQTVSLRVELGSGLLRLGVGFPF